MIPKIWRPILSSKQKLFSSTAWKVLRGVNWALWQFLFFHGQWRHSRAPPPPRQALKIQHYLHSAPPLAPPFSQPTVLDVPRFSLQTSHERCSIFILRIPHFPDKLFTINHFQCHFFHFISHSWTDDVYWMCLFVVVVAFFDYYLNNQLLPTQVVLAHELSFRLPVYGFKGTHESSHHHHLSGYAGICIGDPESGELTISEMSPEEIRAELKR